MKKLVTFMAILSVCLSIFALPTDAEIKEMANKLNVDYSDLKSYVIAHQKIEKSEAEGTEELPEETYGLMFKVEDGEAFCVGSGDEEIKNLVIPETYEGYTVVGVGDYAFEFRDDIETLILPTTLEWLGESAFEGCTNLKKVEIHSENLSINDCIFHQIPDLDIYWYGLNNLANSNFLSCLCEKSARLHAIITADEVDKYAFQDNDQLVSVEFPDNLRKINNNAFMNCSRIESIVIPEGTTYIGNYAFSSCTNLKSVYIPDSVTIMGEYVFNNDASLETVNLPIGLTTIPYGLFCNCSSLKTINIPSSVTIVDENAFYNCESLESITLPSGLTTIGAYAFSNCASLKSLELPASITTIESAFLDGSGIESFTFPSFMKEIPDSFFRECKNLKNVKFNRRISTIEAHAFEGCNSLEKIELPSSLKSIEIAAFASCPALHEIFIPKSVTYIGCECFYNWDTNQTVYLEEGIDTSSWDYEWNITERAFFYYMPNTYVNVVEHATR